jgi:glycosyltransferase involved in cell wall biosynthesis
MVPQKGQADFVEIAGRSLSDDARLHFLLVGDGPLEEDLKIQADTLGLNETGRFRMLPFRRDIARVYAAGDILLHTAHWDPLANVLLEAMAAGLAIVATDVDGTREALDGYPAGALAAPGDVEGMRRLLGDLRRPPAPALAESWRPEPVLREYCRLFETLKRKGEADADG